ncbi:MAG: zinc ribbon domain-containing protein [Drouetiella hepatica Uher 2000/2452]|uniref:Zinc ribbon domain-containing protein n=1 Tax=Drouetiella hepatica Uher 2000/2452 TaxID=904376 RepID=A0A951QCI4_9CYAN|nr:zinc ribbon domain-containing protein [Drouetiella hepatica Uher 2000/2452]
MPTCPRCHQPVVAQAIACPHCRTALKAHGHPGIPLHRSTGGEFLCETCTYHEDDTCNYPQRPYARECTLYQNRFQPIATGKSINSRSQASKNWLRRNATWLILAGIVVVSLALALRSN